MPVDQARFNVLINEASQRVKQARLLDADWPAGTLEAADEALDAVMAEQPLPPTVLFVPPVPAGGVYGRTKWLTGSTGCDVFLPRNTLVVAPADCVVRRVVGGQGISGGAEVIIAKPDNSWAWRFRHVQPRVKVGQQVRQGDTVGVIADDSLDLLGGLPYWFVSQFPANIRLTDYQHCDLSVNKNTDQFPAQGGGGGNVDADEWLYSLGYQGTIVARTPGPPDAQPRARAAYLDERGDMELRLSVIKELGE